MCIRISVVACDVSFVFTLFQFYVFHEHGDARVCFSSVSVLVSLRTAPPALPQRCRTGCYGGPDAEVGWQPGP